MRHIVFRLSLLTALAIWVVLLINLVRMEFGRERALAAQWPPDRIGQMATPIIATPTAAVLEPVIHSSSLQIDPSAVAAIHPKTGRYVSAWLPTSFDADDARASFEANKDIIDELSPFWYAVNSSGRLVTEEGARDQELVRIAHENDVLVLPTIHNVGNPGAAAAVLRDPDLRERHIKIIVDEVLRYGYDGIDIDYESLDDGLRDEFSTFVVELSAAIHSQGKLLSMAVHAKSSDYGGLGGFQDWSVLGEAVDRLRIMTYDYHWRGGGAGPIAPLYWVEEVMAYALTAVDPAKVVVGIPFYAYNWGRGDQRAVAMTWADVERLIETYNVSVNHNERDRQGRSVQESWFVYNGREVWFSNYRSLEAKLDLVQRMDLAGIAIWRLGNEDPKNWNVIRRKLVQDPLTIQRQVNLYLPEH